jgi:hypothetical protein
MNWISNKFNSITSIFYTKTIYVTSIIDKHDYIVNNTGNIQEAADVLAQLKSNLILFVVHLNIIKDTYPEHITYINTLNTKIYDMKIYENSDYTHLTSHVMDKNELHLNIRDKDDKFYNINLLMYICLHLLACVVNPEVGHTIHFSKINKFLIERAIEMHILIHFETQQSYCGMTIP